MKKSYVIICCITFALTLCVGVFAQQNVNPKSVFNNPSRVNVEFTDMSIAKGAVVNVTKPVANSVKGFRGVGAFNIETGTGTGEGWTWDTPVLTILDASDVTITGRANGSSNHHRIVIAAGATTHITLNDASIITGEWESGDYEHPIYLSAGVTLTLTLEGENIIVGGDYVPGISAATGRTLIIDGTGSLSATGGWSCAGIGGGLWDYGPCGTIIINGGDIYAKGANSSWIGTAGAGIGSGAAYACGDITINGGTVTGVPGNETAKGIGNGGADAIGTLTVTGSPIIFATSIADMNSGNKTGGIVVVRNATHWFANDNFTLEHNTTVPSANVLTIDEGKSLTIPAGFTLINEGTIVNYSSITINGTLINNGSILNINSGTINGTVTGNAPTPFTPADNHIDLSNGSPSKVGAGWVFANNVYNILDGADVVITGASSGQRRVEVASNAIANITLNDASITGIGNYQTPLMINQGADVNLILEGENTITSARSKAGVQVPEGATLTIDGTGSLAARGGEYGGAGIGGAFCESCGTITVSGGTITALSVASGSYHDGAGIGGGGAGIVFFSFEGMGGWGGNITINGGIVNAKTDPSSGAAGIGGGSASSNGGMLTMADNGVAFAFSLKTFNGTQTDISNVVNGILFDLADGLLYGTVALIVDVEIPQYYTLTIPEETKLIIPEGRTLTVSGKVINNGTIILCGTIIGTIDNNQPVECEPGMYTVTFYVFDAHTEEPVLDAVITINGIELEGYEIVIVEGNHQYSVSHPLYETYSDWQNVTETMTIPVPLVPKVGIADITINDVVLYPNPFTNEIYISNPSIVKSVVITDVTGQNVKAVTFDGNTISTQGLATGIYFVILESHNGEKIFGKMIKRK